MKNKELIYKDIDTSGLDVIIYTVHIHNNDIFWSSVKLDSIQFEIYQNSTDKDSLLISMIENISQFSKNINNHPNLKRFLSDKNILDKVRNFKLNKIID